MKTTTLAKKLFKAFQNYFSASEFLLDAINYRYSSDIIYPSAFLLRHSAELLLKSLICEFVNDQNIIMNNKKGIFLDVNGNKNRLEGHSLLSLYDVLLTISSSNLVPLIDENPNLRKKIERYNNHDNNSEYFRYHISKNSKSSQTKMFSLGESDIAPDISQRMNVTILTGLDEPIVLKNLDKGVLTKIGLLREIIEMLLKYSRHSKNR
jgi:hypothetical protein